MAKQTFEVTYEGKEDSPVEVAIRPKHYVKYESEYGSLTSDEIGEYTAMLRLAYIAAGVTSKFDEWVDTILDISPSDDLADQIADGGDGGPAEERPTKRR